jgi:hypothetical protein
MRAPRLAILTHLRQGLQQNCMVGRLMRTVWQPAGIEVVLQQGLRNPPEADLALLHVDLTAIPSDYLALAARYPRCLNLAVRDISKRHISRNLVGPDDGCDGPVIVKTDRNYGGRPEHALWLAEGGRERRARDWLCRRLPSAWTGRLRDDAYRVFDRKGDVAGLGLAHAGAGGRALADGPPRRPSADAPVVLLRRRRLRGAGLRSGPFRRLPAA